MAMQRNQRTKHILVATLGGQAQIVTFTLDLLLRHGIPIYEVMVVHPASSPDIQKSLARLNAEFVGDRYCFEGRSMTIRFRRQVLSRYEAIIDDITDESAASGTLDTIGELIRSLKQQQYTIHFSISGGRRLMTFLSFSAALLYFESADRLLHLYTPEDLKKQFDESGVMHVPAGDDQRLIEVPFSRAAQPMLAHLLHAPISSSSTIRQQDEQQQKIEAARRQQVIEALQGKARVLQVLQALAEGDHPSQAATRLNISPSTISTHTSVIYDECRIAWEVPEEIPLNYHFVQTRFANHRFHEASITSTSRKKIRRNSEQK